MNSNKIEEMSQILAELTSAKDVKNFLSEILTLSEIETLSKRWRILEMLSGGSTQRQIAADLKVSLCKVTRGAKILQNKNAITRKYLDKETKNDTNK